VTGTTGLVANVLFNMTLLVPVPLAGMSHGDWAGTPTPFESGEVSVGNVDH
jgi:hypothetical protein